MAGAWQVRAPPSFRATRAWHLAAPAKAKRLAEGVWSFFCSELRRLSLRSLRGGSLYHELLAARTLLELSSQLFRLVV